MTRSICRLALLVLTCSRVPCLQSQQHPRRAVRDTTVAMTVAPAERSNDSPLAGLPALSKTHFSWPLPFVSATALGGAQVEWAGPLLPRLLSHHQHAVQRSPLIVLRTQPILCWWGLG